MAESKTGVMYIGPNVLADGLKRNTVYRDRPIALIEQLSGKYKNISRLFVGINDLSKSVDDVGKAGTPLYLAYKEMEGVK